MYVHCIASPGGGMGGGRRGVNALVVCMCCSFVFACDDGDGDDGELHQIHQQSSLQYGLRSVRITCDLTI